MGLKASGMSEYITQVRELLQQEAPKYNIKVEPKGRGALSIIRNGVELMSIRDADENVEILYQGNKYTYDKWYTKPQHLVQVIVNVLNASQRQG